MRIFLAVIFVFLLCSPSYAELFGHGSEDKIESVVINSTGKVNAISTSHRILGYSITGSANAVASLYDGSTFITEGGCLANDMQTVWFVFPKDIDNYLYIDVNASTTIVTIFYE